MWFFYLPSPADGPNYLLGAGDIYAAATDKPETMDVLRYTGSVDYQLYMVNTRNELSPHKSIDPAEIDGPVRPVICPSSSSAPTCSASTPPT